MFHHPFCCIRRRLHILRKYGKSEHGITRDIIVPADITLHSLHYAIQRLFGWQNSHLHHYEFPDDVFEKLTEGRFSRWCSLAGIYFRFPDEDWEDLYWDDDYEPDQSINSWFKSKYKGPYSYGGLGDYYYENQRKVQELRKELPTVRVWDSASPKQSIMVPIEDISIDDFSQSVYLGGSLSCLLERLTLMEYLYLPDNDYFKEPIDEKIRFYEDALATHIACWRSLHSEAYSIQRVKVCIAESNAHSRHVFEKLGAKYVGALPFFTEAYLETVRHALPGSDITELEEAKVNTFFLSFGNSIS